MKKIYLLFIMFIYFTTSYSENSSEAIMRIRLILLQPITVNCINMNFGTVVAGTNNNQAFGYIDITSQGYVSVRISLDSATKTKNGINLVGPSGSKPLEVVLNSVGEYSTRNNIYELENAPITMPYNGKLKLKIGGILNVPVDQKAGTYSGILNLKVRYN